jgi:Ca2+-binding EF-hand superfamily protein
MEDNGYVSADLMKDVLVRYGTEPLNRNEVEQLCQEAGTSGGRFNYQQFVETMLQKQ